MKPVLLAFSMFTVIPVPGKAVPSAERAVAAVALRLLPVVGAVVGALSGLSALVFWRGDDSGSALLGAVVGITMLVVLTRGLHLDGLADVADGLGSRRPGPGALDVMRQSDIGPFGVGVIVLTLLLQIAAATSALTGAHRWQGIAVFVTAAASGRLAAVAAGRTGIPSARPGGFGALVASSVSSKALLGVGFATLGLVFVATVASRWDWVAIAWCIAAVVIAQVVATVVLHHVVRRIGGVTGDVFGALIEVATTATLLVLAGVVSWRGSL